MDKVYNPQTVESRWLDFWEKNKLYSPTCIDNGRKNYTILLPPPNANASLHAGHAMFVVQDILIRYHRMLGYNAVWIPGTDHAGFETQYVFEKQLAKEGKTRFQFNRKELYDAVYAFVLKNSGLIVNQLKMLGFSLDWSRQTFTLDQHVVDIVYSTFNKLYKDGLVYRDNYIVNYCTHCGTSFSELEVEYIERKDPLVYMQYGPFVLATVRPETQFGDTAIAVHPADRRYQQYIGRKITFRGLLGDVILPVIADEFVDPHFGTGAVKVTPAHDSTDFIVGRRHGLQVKSVIDFDGRLNSFCGQYSGMRVMEARKKIIEDMQKHGLVSKIDNDYVHRVSVCYKCGRDIEPMVLPNWFVKMKPLAERAIQAVERGDIQFHPSRFIEEFYRWIRSIRDWPISRQIVWGIRIPVWYDIAKNPDLLVTFLNSHGETIFGRVDDLMRPKSDGGYGYSFEEIESGLQSLTASNSALFVISKEKPLDGSLYLQETDTFDTWFSSGQWPLVTLRYPDSHDFKLLYPTAVLDTMWDILFFWVARMIMFGLYLTGDVPFRTVLLHSRVIDEKGQKMSKSKGNVINPLDLTAKYGTDAFRFSLIAGSALGNDVPLSENKVKGYRNFVNKIWNSARFVFDFRKEDEKRLGREILGLKQERFSGLYRESIFHLLKYSSHNARDRIFSLIDPVLGSDEDRSILDGLLITAHTVIESIERYRFNDAAEALYNYYWHHFCDRYIEYAKGRREEAQPILEYVLKSSIELLHPFMPFITEEIWQKCPHEGISISTTS